MRTNPFIPLVIFKLAFHALACGSGSVGSEGEAQNDRPDASDDQPAPADPDAGFEGGQEDLCGRSDAERHPSLLIVLDGLRPDYVTAEHMPNLHALGERGIVGERSFAVYPTVTRVNSASVGTGSYPKSHGILHNAMYLPEVADSPFSTGSAARLRELDEATDGQMVTTISLGEALENAGREYFVTGSGGSGNSLLQNPRGSGRGIWTHNVFIPSSAREEAVAVLGEPPSTTEERTVWAFDSYLHHILDKEPPDVVTMWINETDRNGHDHGVGAPETMASVARVDEQIGRILEAHEDAGYEHNIFVTSDHGFTTNQGGYSLRRMLEDAGLDDVTQHVSASMVYLEPGAEDRLEDVVDALRENEAVGSIYTQPGPDGGAVVPGTLSMEVIQWDHPRNPDVLVAAAWNADENAFGRTGATPRFAGNNVATHGSDSPYDLHIPLVAAGPDIRQGHRSQIPSGIVDFAPTLLYLQGIDAPEEMDGRVLCELLKGGPDSDEIHVHAQTHTVSANLGDGRRYLSELDTLQVGTTVYVQGARTTRE